MLSEGWRDLVEFRDVVLQKDYYREYVSISEDAYAAPRSSRCSTRSRTATEPSSAPRSDRPSGGRAVPQRDVGALAQLVAIGPEAAGRPLEGVVRVDTSPFRAEPYRSA